MITFFFMSCLQDRKQPDVCDGFFHDVPFEANFASDIPELQSMTAMPGVDGFTMKVDALYKVGGVNWCTQWHIEIFTLGVSGLNAENIEFIIWRQIQV